MSEKLLKRFERNLESVNESMEKFKQDLDKDPVHALVWSTNVFKTAAEQRLLRRAILALQAGATVEQIKKDLMKKVMHSSKYPPQSTSPTSNLMEQYELAVHAEMLNDLEFVD